MPKQKVAGTGLEQGAETSGKTALSETGGAKSDANRADLSLVGPDLQSLIDAWPKLPDAVKASIFVMVRGVETDKEEGASGVIEKR